jgi:hypothetical protein
MASGIFSSTPQLGFPELQCREYRKYTEVERRAVCYYNIQGRRSARLEIRLNIYSH